MCRRLLPLLLVAIAPCLSSSARAQIRRAEVHPLLESVLSQPSAPIPDSLRGEVGGFQGRSALPGGGEALDLVLRTSATRDQLEALGVQVRTLRAGIATVTVAPAILPVLAARADVAVITLPQSIHLALNKSVSDVGVRPLRSQANGTFTGFTGKNVIVGVIDSGLDFDHPNFQTPAGTTRLLYLWDQTHIPAGGGIKPAGFNYGTEWTAADIDAGIVTETDEAGLEGHGTHVTGIAAGNGAAADENGAFYASAGVAPESKILFVKSKLSEDGIIDALEYIFAKADALGLPCVINLSLGIELGSRTGTAPLEEAIDELVKAKSGRAVVVAAGNARVDSTHATVSTAQGATTNLTFTVPAYSKAAGYDDFVRIAGYYAASDTLSLQLVSPAGVPFTKNLANGIGCSSISVTNEGAIEICNGKKSQLGESTADREIFITISDQNNNAASPPKSGTWQINLTGTTVTSTSGVNFWMYSVLGLSKSARFSSGVSELGTVFIPATSREAITVGSYATRLCWTDFNGTPRAYSSTPTQTLNDISYFSALGPTRDGRIKPDLAAPGQLIASALAHEVKQGMINANKGFLLINDDYMVLEGTSQAAPHVTGAVALLFEQEPSLSAAQVKSKLMAAARNDAFTNAKAGLLGMNVYFGAGKLDLGPWATSDANETNDTATQATPILSGQSMAGYVDRPDDIDLFDLQGVKGGDSLNVTLTALPQDYALQLQASNLIAFGSCSTPNLATTTISNNPGTASESINYLPGGGIFGTSGVPHYLRVTSSAGAFDELSSYQIRGVITRPEQATAHGATSNAQVLPDFKEIKVNGQVGVSGEKDVYALTINNLTTLTVSNSVPLGTVLEILDKNGAVVASSTNGTVSYLAPGGLFGSQSLFVQIRGQVSAYGLTLKKP